MIIAQTQLGAQSSVDLRPSPALLALALLLALARASAIARLCTAHPAGVAEADALALITLGVAVKPTTLVLTVKVDKAVVEAVMVEVEAIKVVEVEAIKVVKVEAVVELIVEVEVELPVLLCPLPPLATEPLPPPTVL